MAKARQFENSEKTYLSRSDVYRDDGMIQLTMEMPGVDKENLDIKIEDDVLIVHGKRKKRKIQGEFRIKEISSGDFHNEYTLDHTIDRDKIDASINNGLLRSILKLKNLRNREV